MKREFNQLLSALLSATVLSNQAVLATVATGIAITTATQASAGEVMQDRCSSRVAFPTIGYDEEVIKPDAPGTVILLPPARGYSEWTSPFTIVKGSDGHVRWWCNSTKGNWADPGTYRFKVDLPKTLECAAQIGVGVVTGTFNPAQLKCVTKTVEIKAGASEYDGWTPERLRCDDRSNMIRARLGPERSLQIECLGTSETKIAPKSVAVSPIADPDELSYCQIVLSRSFDDWPLKPMFSWWGTGRREMFTSTDPRWYGCEGDVTHVDYHFHRLEGLVFAADKPQPQGTVPLYSSWNPETLDNFTSTSMSFPELGGAATRGYGAHRLIGYIYPPDTVQTADLKALNTWYNATTGDFLTSSKKAWQGEVGDSRKGYDLVRQEGFTLRAPK